jgi:hypothetical protein
MGTGIDCRVYVDGERLPDGTPGDDVLAPTGLSGLKITWGRSTTLDQPEPASCTFDVMDTPGGATFIQQFKTGVPIDVYSTGVEIVDPDASLVLDPGFENGAPNAPVTSVHANAVVTYSTRHATGAQAALMTPTDPTKRMWAGFPPAEFSAEVDAWDSVPQPEVGSPWSLGATVRAPAGARVQICPILFPDPTGAAPQLLEGAGIVTTAGGGWEVFEFDYVAAHAGYWVGVAVVVDLLPTWLDFHDVTTRTNFITGPNFENSSLSNISNISAAVSSIDPAVAHTGTKSVKVVTPGAVAMEGVQVAAPAPLSSGPLYSFGIWVKAAAGVKLTLLTRFNGSSAGQGTTNITASGAWEFVKFDGLPSAAFNPITGAQIMVRTTVVAATTFWVDDAIVEMAPTTGGSFDGSTPPAGGLIYRWTAAPNASTSEEVRPASWANTPGSWLDYAVASVDDVVVNAPAGGTPRRVSVFSGRVTDLEAEFDDAIGCPVVHVTAQDFTADMENIDVGDEPWSVESMEDRFLRIVALSGFDVTSIIDDTVAGIPVSYQDVDAQGTAGLLRDLAQSVDAVLWSAVHSTTGAYLRVEDPANRAALFTLAMVDGVVVIIPRGSAAAVLDISACDVLRDPVRWEQSVSDVSTRVAVQWLEQAVDDEGKPTTNEHTETLVDAELEVDHGKRRISVSTLLTTSADAADVATRILARTGSTGWRVSGFQIVDDASLEVVDDEAVRMMMRLLDGTSRIGLPIRLVDMPTWSPVAPTVGVYLEGGEYLFAGGAWSLSLTVSNAVAVGESLPWNGVPPAWRWVDFDPEISWLDMVGVAAPPGGKF